MQVILCLPDVRARDFCKKRIAELAKTDHADVTLEALNIRSLENITGSLDRFVFADLIVLGIDASFDGMAAAKILRKAEVRADIVFFTRAKNRVFEAFDVSALHYLVDGETSLAKFDEVFRRARMQAETRTQASIVLSCAGEQRKLPISQIYYFEVINRIVTVHYSGGTFEFYSTLSKIEDTLTNRGFIRIHRSYLVAERFITGIAHGEVSLVNGALLPVGGRYADNIKLS
ncbi:MAG: LytR/AlgR family response regulator transcription factor [Spirochaetales bacterium]